MCTDQPGFESSLENKLSWFIFGARHDLAYFINDHSKSGHITAQHIILILTSAVVTCGYTYCPCSSSYTYPGSVVCYFNEIYISNLREPVPLCCLHNVFVRQQSHPLPTILFWQYQLHNAELLSSQHYRKGGE